MQRDATTCAQGGFKVHREITVSGSEMHISHEPAVDRAARLETAKADIIAHLQDGNLSVAWVADRHGVVSRYLQKLFDADGTSFSEFVANQRLATAYRMLTNRLHSLLAISSVAYDVGFNDLSYFNRAFRRRYGSTPSDIRRAADEVTE